MSNVPVSDKKSSFSMIAHLCQACIPAFMLSSFSTHAYQWRTYLCEFMRHIL